MAESGSSSSSQTDSRNGYSYKTKTYHSLRPSVSLPPLSQPLSITSYALSLLSTPPPTTTFLIDSTTNQHISYPNFLQQLTSLSYSLKPLVSNNDVAFILSPPSIHIPLLYLSLLSLGATVSPANPLSSSSELSHQIQLCKPSIVFATTETSHKLTATTTNNSNYVLILLDSPQFHSMLVVVNPPSIPRDEIIVKQSDPAAILYSSGTTGKVKGVVITHRNFIAVIAGMYHNKVLSNEQEEKGDQAVVSLFTLPLFHVFGFFMLIRAVSMGDTVVLMDKFDFVKMLEAVEKYKVTYIPVTPPLIVAMLKSDLVDKYDLSTLQGLGCGGAPLGKEVANRFRDTFPYVEIFQGFGMTETSGAATRTIGPEEAQHYGSAGRLNENFEAKIVDPETGEALPPGQRGELWLRGPAIMKGYAGDEVATASTLDSEGWLKTGDLCYFDEDGFLYVVDRLKELIKYKAYQVPPAELEHILQSIPGIADAAVIPYPDEEAGEIPMAYVVRKPDSTISATQIMDLIAKQVAPYKKIRRVTFINSIPKSPAGKILRRELVNQAISSSSSKL